MTKAQNKITKTTHYANKQWNATIVHTIHTQCNEVLFFSGLRCSHWAIVEQQAIACFCDELQRDVALEANLMGGNQA